MIGMTPGKRNISYVLKIIVILSAVVGTILIAVGLCYLAIADRMGRKRVG